MPWRYTTLAAPLLVGTVLLLAIAVTTWRRRPQRAGRTLSALVLAMAVYVVGYAFELGSTSVDGVRFWLQVQYLGIANVPVLVLATVLAYGDRNLLLRPAPLAALFTVPAITCVLAITSGGHELIWGSLSIDRSAGFTRTHFERGGWYWIHNIYIYLLVGAAVLLLLDGWRRSSGLLRRQVTAMLVGLAVPAAIHLAYLAYPVFGGLDPNPYGMLFASGAIAWGVLGLRLGEILPVARDAVLASMSDGVVVVDRHDRIAHVNCAAEELLGKTLAEAVGRPAAEVCPEWPRLPRVVGGDQPTRQTATIEVDGESRDYDIASTPLSSRSGRPDGHVLVLRDTTASNLADQRLRLLSVAVEAADDAVVITDRDGKIVWVNPAFTRLTGYEAEEAVGKNPRLLRSGSHDESFFSDLWETVLAGRVWRGEMINRRKDGKTYTEQQTISPVHDEAGVVSHFVAIKQDVSRRKQVEELRASLTRTMVHDLRSPLTVIHGSLQALTDDTFPTTEATRRAALELSAKHTERLLRLVNAILEVEELKSGKLPLRRAPKRLEELVDEALRLCTPLAESRQQSLGAVLKDPLEPVDADPELVGRVLQNLVSNALKFSPEGSSVQVRARAEPMVHSVQVEVVDQGPGVEPTLLPRIFDEFVSGPGGARGGGLGLAFCRLAIEAHGGRIGVDSDPGRGSVFWFTLPTMSGDTLASRERREGGPRV